MKCECGSKNTKIINVRESQVEIAGEILVSDKRRHECKDCGNRFTTYEIEIDKPVLSKKPRIGIKPVAPESLDGRRKNALKARAARRKQTDGVKAGVEAFLRYSERLAGRAA